MSSKLCYNCFEKISADDLTCSNCGVVLAEDSGNEEETKRFQEPKRDYDKEISKLEQVNRETGFEKNLRLRGIQKDLRLIVITASILGLLQIYSAFLLTKINAIGPLFGADQIIDSWVLIVSGFVYFSSVFLFYYRFFFFRKIFLLLNMLHLILLFLMYDKLDVILVNLSSDDPLDLPVIVQDFLLNIHTFEWVLIGFGICYVVQSAFMYKFELLKVSYGPRRGRN
jgi:hypothetical protein